MAGALVLWDLGREIQILPSGYSHVISSKKGFVAKEIWEIVDPY
jgi:hypothetical protein